MIEQTTFCEAGPNSGKTGLGIKTESANLNTRPEILRIPQNLFLIAETRGSKAALYDAIQKVDRVLRALE